MAAPFFYIPSWSPDQQEIALDEDNSRHVIQVLRMRPGEALRLTDGKGALLDGVILDDHKKKCRVSIKAAITEPPRNNHVTIPPCTSMAPSTIHARPPWAVAIKTNTRPSKVAGNAQIY